MSRYTPVSTLPPFEPVTLVELRSFWNRYPDPDLRRLMLEVQRYRLLIAEIDRHYERIHKAWYNTVGGHLVALHQMQGLMFKERFRLP
ncbi:hypothetical protein [Pseudomonas fragariae (ex Marin et al. 2024)]|uniref:hypothetical protein n=1 Tax=Pseudomonas fragariae (ex Marin et al. 2024) TaxID=3080056 RepID=UPI003F7B260C